MYLVWNLRGGCLPFQKTKAPVGMSPMVLHVSRRTLEQPATWNRHVCGDFSHSASI